GSSPGQLLAKDHGFPPSTREANQDLDTTLERIAKRGATSEAGDMIAKVAEPKRAHEQATERVGAERRADSELAHVAQSFDQHVIPTFDALEQAVKSFAKATERQREHDRQQAAEVAANANMSLLSV